MDVGLSNLPDGWVWTKLEEISEIILGQSPPSSTYNTDGKGLPFYQGKLEFGKTYPTLLKWCTAPKKIAEKGDIFISVRAPVGPTNVCPEKSCVGRGLAAIRGLSGIEPFFILYLMRAYEDELAGRGVGTTFNAITGNQLKTFEIPLPPLPEQHRIVAKIEELFTKLDAGINELYKAQSQLKRYRQSVLKAAFEGKLTETWRAEHQGEIEPVSVLLERILKERREKWEAEQLEQMKAKGKMPKDDKWKMKYKEPIALDTSNLPKLPDGWRWTTVGSISLIASGQTPKGINDLDSAGEIPFYKISDMNKLGSEKFMRTTEITLDNDEIERLRIHVREQGTVVFPKRGGAIATNKKRILSCPSAYDLNIMGVLPYIVPTDFFYQWLLSIDLAALSDGSNVPQLNHKDINPLPFPLPPLSEQQAIISEVESRLSIAEAVEKTITVELKRAEQLRQSILKKAFSGKLVPQDPNDKSASILLERIKAEKLQHAQGQLRLKLA